MIDNDESNFCLAIIVSCQIFKKCFYLFIFGDWIVVIWAIYIFVGQEVPVTKFLFVKV